MGLVHYERRTVPALLVCAFLFCPTGQASENQVLNILLDSPPATINPRLALDAAGQRVDELLFTGLVQLDKNLTPSPALAESWRTEKQGTVWRFKMRPDAKDGAGVPISAEKMAACLDSYRTGKPTSPYVGSFPAWRSTEVSGSEVVLHLSTPDPYILRNLTLLRYFRTSGSPTPCTEPKIGDQIIGSGIYRFAHPEYESLFPESELLLLPNTEGPHPLHLIFSIDENSKAVKMLRGEVDVAHYSLSTTKTFWFEKNHPELFKVLERDGVPVTYLAFNLKNPILAHKEVRQAIARALDRISYVHYKLFDLVSEGGSLLAPMLPESTEIHIPYDLAEAEKLLDKAGYPRGPDGVRFRILMKSTPARDGIETNQVFQSMLARVGIDIKVEVVEPAVFLASVRKRNFEMYVSRWIGLSDGSIFYRILHSKGPDNRASYKNPEVDELLDQAIREMDTEKRIDLIHRVQLIMADELPYFPLWHSKITILVHKNLTGLESSDLSLSASLVPLAKLR